MRCSSFIAGLVVCLFLIPFAEAQDKKKLTVADIKTLAKVLPESQVIEKIRSHGLAFTWSAELEARLKATGLKPEVLEVVEEVGSPKRAKRTLTVADIRTLLKVLGEKETIAKIQEMGCAFAWSAEAEKALEAAGAGQAVVDAVKASTSAGGPTAMKKGILTVEDIINLSKIFSEKEVIAKIKQHGVTFELSVGSRRSLRTASVSPGVLDALEPLSAETAAGYEARGKARLNAGEYAGAIRDYRKHLELVGGESPRAPWSYYFLGYCHSRLERHAQALVFFRQSAAEGNAFAMDALGEVYVNGRGVQRDYAQGAVWYSKAAKAGNASAMSSLGGMYLMGVGVSRDYGQALGWFEKAAAKGSAWGMHGAGLAHQHREKRDLARAVAWYQKAHQADPRDETAIRLWICRRLLGEKAKADSALRAHRTNRSSRGFYAEVMKALLEEVTPEECLSEIDRTSSEADRAANHARAHFYLGVLKGLQGDKVGAIKALERCKEHGHLSVERESSRAELRRLSGQ